MNPLAAWVAAVSVGFLPTPPPTAVRRPRADEYAYQPDHPTKLPCECGCGHVRHWHAA